MSEWQSIETAPKDGTHILIYGVADQSPWEPLVYVVKWDLWPDGVNGQWLEAAGDGFYTFEATHWMPLPTPPALTQGARND